MTTESGIFESICFFYKWGTLVSDTGVFERLSMAALPKWGLSTLTSLKFLGVSLKGCEEGINLFPDEGLLPTILTQLHIYYIQKLEGKGFRQLTYLQQLHIGSLELKRTTLPERDGKIGPRLLISRSSTSITNIFDVQWLLSNSLFLYGSMFFAIP